MIGTFLMKLTNLRKLDWLLLFIPLGNLKIKNKANWRLEKSSERKETLVFSKKINFRIVKKHI